MSYNVVFTPSFKRSIQRLEKRFPHVKRDLHVAIQTLLQNPKLGVVIPGGSGVRKLRVRNSDLTKGKSGGYRLLYYLEDRPKQLLYLLLLYVKSDQADTTHQELQQLLDELTDIKRG